MGKASRTKQGRPGPGNPAADPAGPGEAAPRDRSGAGAGAPASPWHVPVGLALILIAAAIFRAVYFFLDSRSPIFFDGLFLDSSVYDGWARSIAAGEWIGREAFYFPPLYPYLLGLFYRVFGHSYALVYLAQQLLGLLNLVLIFRIGEAVFNARAALFAAGLAALYAPFAFFETKILGTTLGLTLNLAALLFLVRAERSRDEPGAWRPWLIAGAVIGVAALCLPGTILLAILAALNLARWRKDAALALAAGAFAALLPVLAHNLYVAGDPLLLSGQGGITFYQGNNPSARGLYNVVPGFSGAPERQAREEKAIAERDRGRTLRRSEISAHFFRKGLAFVIGSPAQWLLLEGRKLLALFGTYEASTEYSLYRERGAIAWLWVAFLPYAALAGLGLAAFVGAPGHSGASALLARRPARPGARNESWTLPLYTLYAAGVPLLFYISSRYRLPLVPVLAIYAGALLDRVASDLHRFGEVRFEAARAIGVALLVGLVSFFPLGAKNVTAEANVNYNIGNLLADRKAHEEAVRSFDAALAEWPTHAFALINRGNSLDKLGRPEEAIDSYRRAEEAQPDFWTAYEAQGIILHRLGRHEDEAEVYRRGLQAGGAQAHFLLAVALQETHRLDEAEREIGEAIRLAPLDPRFHNTLGTIREGRGNRRGAIEAYKQAGKVDPRYTKSRFNLALLHRELGNVSDAAQALQEALAIDPRDARGHARLGEVYALMGESRKAREEYQTALSLDPREPLAAAGLARLAP